MITFKSHPQRKNASIPASSTLTLSSPAGWLTGSTGSMDKEAAMKLSACNRAVNYLSDMVGMMPMSVRNWHTQAEVQDHYLGNILWNRPNEAMTPFTFWKLMECNRLLFGNGYAYIHRDGNGRPVELIWLPPDCVEPYLAADGRLLYRFFHPTNGRGYLLDPMEVLHYKAYTEDGIHGISVLRHARDTLEAAAAREAYDKAVYQNGGSPAGTLETDTDLRGYAKGPDGKPLQRSDGSYVTLKDNLRGEWERVHSGAANAFRVAILDLGLTYKPIAVNNRDAQFVESKAISVEDTARFFGIPLNKLFTGKQSYNSNEANSLDVLTDTLQPTITQYEQEDKWKLLTTSETGSGLYIRRNMMVTLRSDTAARAAWYKTMREVGAYDVDTILHKEGEPGTGTPGGKKRLYSKNFDDLENLGKPQIQAGGAM
ncbi:phage portal protein [uncultured Dysosmobacter sp.]|uniref:phage portal protein n=1 Tax=uncultured Dysosmobacter sp. TaxID=2591384 RepID=UPI002671F3D1|nr:phage portal protein [uncultured Dysosmobacter sp.]